MKQFSVILFGCVLLGVLVGGPVLADRKLRDQNYKDFRNHTVSDTWSPGTLDSAKFVITEILTKTKDPGNLYLNTYHQSVYSRISNPLGHYDSYEIVYKDVHMLLNKKDYFAYVRWVKKISEPYITGKQFLNPPLLPPPWDI